MRNPTTLLALLLMTTGCSTASSPAANPKADASMGQRLAGKIVIAHRGASGYLPEHTLEAKSMAYAQGAHYIEQDVVLTKDDVPVVLHDIHIDTVTNVAKVFPERKREDGRYYAIDFTLAELKTLRVNERIDLKTGAAVYGSRFPVGGAEFTIPTLAEEIDLIQGLNASTKGNVGLYPEIKAPAFHRAQGKDISKITLELLASRGYSQKTDSFYVQCFDWNETQRIRNELKFAGKLVQLIAENSWNEAPNVDYSQLITTEGLKTIAAVVDGVGPWLPHVVRGVLPNGKTDVTNLVTDAHAAGLQVHPYTVRVDALPDYASDPETALRMLLLDANVDGIFTDFPDVGVAFVERGGGR